MQKPSFKKELQKATDYLIATDPILVPVIKANDLPSFEPHSDYYGALVNSMIGQQLSVKAAASIKQRFVNLFDGIFPTPEQILSKSVEDLRAVGFSRNKANYVHDLSQHIIDGKLIFDKFDKQTNQQIIDELVQVKGIGEWTAHMFLIFCMGRLDVLPTGDLGIRNGVRQLYGFEGVPTPEEVALVAHKNNWHPYESVASWYVWRSLNNDPA